MIGLFFRAAQAAFRSPLASPLAMADPNTDPTEHLERARDLVWKPSSGLKRRSACSFAPADCHVAQVNGDGVRNVIEVTETMADMSGDLTQCHIEIGKIGKRERGPHWK